MFAYLSQESFRFLRSWMYVDSSLDFVRDSLLFVYPSFRAQQQLFVFLCIPFTKQQSRSRLKYFRSTALKAFLLEWSLDYEILEQKKTVPSEAENFKNSPMSGFSGAAIEALWLVVGR